MLVRNLEMTPRHLLFAAALSPLAIAQVSPPVILDVDIRNVVQYIDDTTDFTKLATAPGATVGGASLNFRKFISLADIVAVNGKPAKGTLIQNSRAITLRPSPNPGEAISDSNRNNLTDFGFEFLTVDGDQIGSVVGLGMGNGPAPPGAPKQITQGNNPITGGSGAFLGARGVMGQSVTPQTIATRVASMAEDPANRRTNGGGSQKYILQIIPMMRPEIATTSSGAAVFHADFSPVTAAKPAKTGEVLIARASGLGPTLPGVDPGQPFPTEAVQQVNSPVDVLVNGKLADVLNKIGWPGLTDVYRVDFKVPDQTASGSASLQLSAAWIAGAPVNIPVQ